MCVVRVRILSQGSQLRARTEEDRQKFKDVLRDTYFRLTYLETTIATASKEERCHQQLWRKLNCLLWAFWLSTLRRMPPPCLSTFQSSSPGEVFLSGSLVLDDNVLCLTKPNVDYSAMTTGDVPPARLSKNRALYLFTNIWQQDGM